MIADDKIKKLLMTNNSFQLLAVLIQASQSDAVKAITIVFCLILLYSLKNNLMQLFQTKVSTSCIVIEYLRTIQSNI